jgi:membrane protein
MSIGEVHQGPAAGPALSGRVPLWVIAATALLVAAGFAKRPARAPCSARGDHADLGVGRDRPTMTPSKIPARGWKDVLLGVYNGISEDRILANAAGVTFYALLALFPGIAALVSMYGLFADPSSIAGHLDTISGVAPGGAIDVVREQITSVSAQGRTTLGISFALGLVVSLWSANSGIKALFDALNVVYEEKEKRSFIQLNAITLLFTIGTMFFLMIALACVIALPVALNYLTLPPVIGPLLKLARWPILLLLAGCALTLIYRYGPTRIEPRWQWITWGSVFAAVAWLAASVAFSWYAGNFGSFNKTYGSLGAVIGFMTWIWLSTIVVLVGGKLNAEIEDQPRLPKLRRAGMKTRTLIERPVPPAEATKPSQQLIARVPPLPGKRY